ncbi:hypothetical protein TrispH2_010931 [Trichoplax sp. H2]|nr:hypothetical protein TrispH2_010931 [Trichoplax sp. H2]|eukprot:RDD36587.1 hypothetical protein TrispH2_010931 [Trichoplax sp. H2]
MVDDHQSVLGKEEIDEWLSKDDINYLLYTKYKGDLDYQLDDILLVIDICDNSDLLINLSEENLHIVKNITNQCFEEFEIAHLSSTEIHKKMKSLVNKCFIVAAIRYENYHWTMLVIDQIIKAELSAFLFNLLGPNDEQLNIIKSIIAQSWNNVDIIDLSSSELT